MLPIVLSLPDNLAQIVKPFCVSQCPSALLRDQGIQSSHLTVVPEERNVLATEICGPANHDTVIADCTGKIAL